MNGKGRYTGQFGDGERMVQWTGNNGETLDSNEATPGLYFTTQTLITTTLRLDLITFASLFATLALVFTAPRSYFKMPANDFAAVFGLKQHFLPSYSALCNYLTCFVWCLKSARSMAF